MFVYIGCPCGGCIGPKQYFKPVINPSELFLALEEYEHAWFETETTYLGEFLEAHKGFLTAHPESASSMALQYVAESEVW